MIYNYKKMWGGQHSKYSVLNFIKNTILLNNCLSRSKHGLLRLEQLLRITHKEFWSKKNTEAYIHHIHDTGKVS